MRLPTFAALKQKARTLKQEIHALFLAGKDPRLPWYTRALSIIIVGYALSPIDLIPDPIPVIGYIDDLVLLPLGIALLIKLIPPEILADCRRKAQQSDMTNKSKNWIAGGIVIAVWVGVFAGIGVYLYMR